MNEYNMLYYGGPTPEDRAKTERKDRQKLNQNTRKTLKKYGIVFTSSFASNDAHIVVLKYIDKD